MGCFGNVLVLHLIFFAFLSPNVYSNQSAVDLPGSNCAVTSFVSKQVDVNCAFQLPDFSMMNFPLAPYVSQVQMTLCTFSWVPKKTFQGLTGLKQLYLQCDGRVPELQFEEGSLDHLPYLRLILITGTVIKSLPDDIFCHLPRLDKLYLLNNSVTTTDIIGFGRNCSASYCGNDLAVLQLSWNFITHLPNRTFCSLRNLLYLDLSRNGMMSIDEDALVSLGSLRVLDLSFNNLTSLPETTLEPLTGLYNLDLDGNMNLNISGFLKYVPNLKGLFLPGIGLEFIEKDAFQGLSKVESLMLYKNRLHTIDEDVLEPLIGITDSSINETGPTECEEDAVDRLVFGGEYMKLIDQLTRVVNVTGVRYLNLDMNNFTTMPPIRKMYKLLVFSIAKNKIETLGRDDFSNLLKLQRLTLSYNRIQSIGHGVFANLKCLKQLLLNDNSIGFINNTAFHGLTALTEIQLQNNRIKDIRGIFARNENLNLLNLASNYLEELSLEMLPPNIVKLDVSFNSIKHLAYTPNLLSTQLYMVSLNLSHNDIRDINKNFFPISLTDLLLHDNSIESINSCVFCSMTAIITITLHNNLLRTVHPEDLRIYTLPVYQKIPAVSFSGNNFTCDCELQEMRYLAYDQSYLKIKDMHSLYCHREYSKNKPSRIRIVESQAPEDFLCRISLTGNESRPETCSIYHDLEWKYVIGDCSRKNLPRIPNGIPSGVIKLYLDGNNFSKLPNSTFQVHSNLSELYLNSSHLEAIEDYAFLQLVNLSHLHLESNELSYLSNSTFAGLHRLVELSLSFNKLRKMDDRTFHPLKRLSTLQLDNNQLRLFPVWNLKASQSLASIRLSENPWSCDCDYVQDFREWLQDWATAVVDTNELYCKFDDNSTAEVPLIAFNSSHCYHIPVQSFLESKQFPLMTGLMVSLLTFAITGILLYLYRKEMQVLIYSRYGVRIFHKNDAQRFDGEKTFDAFICYSNSDEDFVIDQLLPNLEGIDPPFRCCIHQRDFLVGGFITDNILEGVSKSRRTILVLTEAFISSEWCRFEFKTAYVQMLKDKCNRVIVVVVGEIPKQLDPEMKLYLKTNTYISWGDKLFWERLYFAMPDRTQTPRIGNDIQLS